MKNRSIHFGILYTFLAVIMHASICLTNFGNVWHQRKFSIKPFVPTPSIKLGC